MFDHAMLRTQQSDVMTAFYEKALAPLGIKKLMAFDGGAGFGREASGLWISKSSEPRSSVHLALSSPDKSAVRRARHRLRYRCRNNCYFAYRGKGRNRLTTRRGSAPSFTVVSDENCSCHMNSSVFQCIDRTRSCYGCC